MREGDDRERIAKGFCRDQRLFRVLITVVLE